MTTKAVKITAVLFLCLLFSSTQTLGASVIFINEIAWMGTEDSANNEWIELYNPSGNLVNLEGWVLRAEDGTPSIELKGIIPSQGFFLLERTDDETVPGIEADSIYKGALSNKGEHLTLVDAKGIMIDGVACPEGWPAGNNTTKQTMELVAGKWQTSQLPNGTPKQTNSPTLTGRSFAPSSSIPLEPATKPALPRVLPEIEYPANVYINEMLPSPEDPDAENEWIELYNANNFEVLLAGWQLRDGAGAVVSYLFPADTKIAPTGFLLCPIAETGITLQNSGDALELLNPAQEVVHKVNYPKAIRGESYNRTVSGWQWSEILTPNEENVVVGPKSVAIEPSETAGLAEMNTEGLETERKALAEIKKGLPRASSKALTFLFAAVIAILSAIVVLFLKKKIGIDF